MTTQAQRFVTEHEPVAQDWFIEPGYELCLECVIEDCYNWAPKWNLSCKRHCVKFAPGSYAAMTPTQPIPLPDTLKPGLVPTCGSCKYCNHIAECAEDVSAGMPTMCEYTAAVFVGGVLVRL